jgi:hypothetical protein
MSSSADYVAADISSSCVLDTPDEHATVPDRSKMLIKIRAARRDRRGAMPVALMARFYADWREFAPFSRLPFAACACRH